MIKKYYLKLELEIDTEKNKTLKVDDKILINGLKKLIKEGFEGINGINNKVSVSTNIENILTLEDILGV